MGQLKDPPKVKPIVDGITGILVLSMVAGLPLVGWFYHRGVLPFWITIVFGTLLMNLSFTAWHETSHQNFSKFKWLNHLVGWIASLASIYPGYFSRRREHLIHHRWAGDKVKDPVYPRIQSTFLSFPKVLINSNRKFDFRNVPESFNPVTRGQRGADLASNWLVVGLVISAIFYGFFEAVFWAWIVPRFFIFFIHAYFICYLPHAMERGGYQVNRVRCVGWVYRFVTVEQNMHGIHHAWPWIPWHQYHNFIPLSSDTILRKNIEVV